MNASIVDVASLFVGNSVKFVDGVTADAYCQSWFNSYFGYTQTLAQLALFVVLLQITILWIQYKHGDVGVWVKEFIKGFKEDKTDENNENNPPQV